VKDDKDEFWFLFPPRDKEDYWNYNPDWSKETVKDPTARRTISQRNQDDAIILKEWEIWKGTKINFCSSIGLDMGLHRKLVEQSLKRSKAWRNTDRSREVRDRDIVVDYMRLIKTMSVTQAAKQIASKYNFCWSWIYKVTMKAR